LVDILDQKTTENNDFFSRVKLDKLGELSNVFFRDSIMKEDYQNFGDVVVFDTTYKKNHYGLIGDAFVRKNNH